MSEEGDECDQEDELPALHEGEYLAAKGGSEH